MKENKSNLTGFVAWTALIISLTGGIPGVITSYQSIDQKPKLSMVAKNSLSANFTFEGIDKTGFLVLMTIANNGKINFKRSLNPEVEFLINDKWVKLNPMGLMDKSLTALLRNFPDIDKNPYKTWVLMLGNTYKDYYITNSTIQPNESIDVFMFCEVDSKILSIEEFNKFTKFKVVLTDIKNRKYTKIFSNEDLGHIQ